MALEIVETPEGWEVTLVKAGGAAGSEILEAETPEDVRQLLQLGTAAIKNTGQETGDLVSVGDYGIAPSVTAMTGTDLNTLNVYGLYVVTDALNSPLPSEAGTWFVRVEVWNAAIGTEPLRIIQFADGYGSAGSLRNRLFMRVYYSENAILQWSEWVEK